MTKERTVKTLLPGRIDTGVYTVYYRPVESGEVEVGLLEVGACVGGAHGKAPVTYHMSHMAPDMEAAQAWGMTVDLKKPPKRPSNPAGPGMPDGRLPQ